MNNYKTLRLMEAFAECTKHSQRMLSAHKKVCNIFPLDVNKYLILTDDEIEHIDQLVYRFSKLQDSIGERLFKSLLMFLEEDVKNKPFLDVLNRLEQLEILPSKDEWLRLRQLRNELSHEYSNEDEENVTLLKWKYVIAFLVILSAIYLTHPLYLKALGYSLVVSDPLVKSDAAIVVVLDGDTMDERLLHSVQLWRSGYAPKVILSAMWISACIKWFYMYNSHCT